MQRFRLDSTFDRVKYGLLWNDFRANMQAKNYVHANQVIMNIMGLRSAKDVTMKREHSRDGSKGSHGSAALERLEYSLESNDEGMGLGILQKASAYSLIGNRDRTMQYLEQAYETRQRGLNELVSNPDWEPLHSDPRFRALANRMNLPLPN